MLIEPSWSKACWNLFETSSNRKSCWTVTKIRLVSHPSVWAGLAVLKCRPESKAMQAQFRIALQSTGKSTGQSTVTDARYRAILLNLT